jgi:hypothetical protein
MTGRHPGCRDYMPDAEMPPTEAGAIQTAALFTCNLTYCFVRAMPIPPGASPLSPEPR